MSKGQDCMKQGRGLAHQNKSQCLMLLWMQQRTKQRSIDVTQINNTDSETGLNALQKNALLILRFTELVSV